MPERLCPTALQMTRNPSRCLRPYFWRWRRLPSRSGVVAIHDPTTTNWWTPGWTPRRVPEGIGVGKSLKGFGRAGEIRTRDLLHPKPNSPITTRCPFPTAYKCWKWPRAVETCRYSLKSEATTSYILTTVRKVKAAPRVYVFVRVANAHPGWTPACFSLLGNTVRFLRIPMSPHCHRRHQGKPRISELG